MFASPHRIIPSSTVSESHCRWYGCNAFGISLISSSYLAMIMSARHLVVDHLGLQVGSLISSQHQYIHG